jgi:hypothetical protein
MTFLLPHRSAFSFFYFLQNTILLALFFSGSAPLLLPFMGWLHKTECATFSRTARACVRNQHGPAPRAAGIVDPSDETTINRSPRQRAHIINYGLGWNKCDFGCDRVGSGSD